jgi:site-specific DNA-adenine methylase
MKNPAFGPFFPYYGAKWRTSGAYPAPKWTEIVEPFAGAAGYSIRWSETGTMAAWRRSVTLVDASPHVISAWSYLIRAASDPSALEALPEQVRHVDEVPEAARALVGFWLNPGSGMPKKSASNRADPTAKVYFAGSVWSAKTKARLLREVHVLKDWQIEKRDWRETFASLTSRNRCTVFVDPPYVGAGRHYSGAKWADADYADLAEACRRADALGNQVIVCEGAGAKWLPFQELHAFHGSIKESVEVLWTGTGG